MKKQKRQLPKTLQKIIAISLGLLLSIVCGSIISALQPPSDSVTLEHLQNTLKKSSCKYVFIQIEDINDAYYEVAINEEFTSLLALGQWHRQCRKPEGEKMLVMPIVNSHWVFYSDGSVGAYAPHWVSGKKQLYYKIPNDVADQLIDYVSSNGIVREYGYFTDDTTHFEYDEHFKKQNIF